MFLRIEPSSSLFKISRPACDANARNYRSTNYICCTHLEIVLLYSISTTFAVRFCFSSLVRALSLEVLKVFTIFSKNSLLAVWSTLDSLLPTHRFCSAWDKGTWSARSAATRMLGVSLEGSSGPVLRDQVWVASAIRASSANLNFRACVC